MRSCLILLAFFSLIFIGGCEYTSASHAAAKGDAESPKQICTKMKRQILYNASNRNVEAPWMDKQSQQRLQDQFTANNCQAILVG